MTAAPGVDVDDAVTDGALDRYGTIEILNRKEHQEGKSD